MDSDKILIQLNNASYKYPGGEFLFENENLRSKKVTELRSLVLMAAVKVHY